MNQRIEALAEAIWRYYYPQGGSIYSTYASLPEHDKIIHRKEAAQVTAFLSGTATIEQLTPIALCHRNEAGQISLKATDGDCFDMSKHTGQTFYIKQEQQ